MKLKDILKNLNSQTFPFYDEEFLQEFGIHDYVNLHDNGFTEAYIKVWYCTDTWVGLKVILLNSEPICISSQNCRKGDMYYEWLNEEKFLRTKKFVESLIDEPDKINTTYANLEEDFDCCYSVAYTDQLMENFHSKAIHNDKNVTLDWVKIRQEIQNDRNTENVWVFSEEGQASVCLDISELKFPINTIN
jgi:hypothetical protein